MHVGDILTGILVALCVYLVKLVLQLDKKVAVLCAEVDHLKERIKDLSKRIGGYHGSGSDRQG